MQIAKMIFLMHSKTCLKRAFCKMYATICGWVSQDEGAVACYNTQLQVKYTAKWGVQIAKWFLKYISELFSYYFVIFFNYALFYFIFIQSFCFNQNCLKVYFRITIYFLEDFYGFICLFCYSQYVKKVFFMSLCF